MKKKREEAERLAEEKVAKEIADIDAEEAKRKAEKEKMLQDGVNSAKAKMQQAEREKKEKQQSAVKIQSTFRGKKARQERIRRQKGREEEEKEKKRKEREAVEEEARKEQENKATQIQAQWRSKLAQRCVQEIDSFIFIGEDQRQPLIEIACYLTKAPLSFLIYSRQMLEKKASLQERQYAAATVIQCAFRGYKATKRLAKLKRKKRRRLRKLKRQKKLEKKRKKQVKKWKAQAQDQNVEVMTPLPRAFFMDCLK